jgi:hypothetical protein
MPKIKSFVFTFLLLLFLNAKCVQTGNLFDSLLLYKDITKNKDFQVDEETPNLGNFLQRTCFFTRIFLNSKTGAHFFTSPS